MAKTNVTDSIIKNKLIHSNIMAKNNIGDSIRYNTSLFIFRRDYRLTDNTGLIHAFKKSNNVIPAFIFTPKQISSNPYKSSNAIQFMIESLADLDQQISKINKSCHLWIQMSDEITAIENIMAQHKFDAIFVNRDYTPYAIKRDRLINNWCKINSVDFKSYTDCMLIDNAIIMSGSNKPYHNYTLFLKKCLQLTIRKPKRITNMHFVKPSGKFKTDRLDKFKTQFLTQELYEINDNIAVKGGRSNGLKLLAKSKKILKTYVKNKNYPSHDTTHLSAHNKFGTLSIREVYYIFKLDKSGEMCRKLFWRDFYYYVAINFPEFYKHGHILKPNAKNINRLWSGTKSQYKKWCNGKTGFPFVDAAMTELNTTGFMHNRARLVVSEFLVKDLLVNWSLGEQWFSKKLVDIDRTQNIGNWNWSSSFGLDSTPFLRTFNPWTQSKTYDPDCIYIKRWLIELKNVPTSHIHSWYKYHEDYDIDYPAPIVDHSVQRKKFIKNYKKIFG